MAFRVDTSDKKFETVREIEIRIGNDCVKHSFGKAVSMDVARKLALHFVGVFTGEETTLSANTPLAVDSSSKDDSVSSYSDKPSIQDRIEKAAGSLLRLLYPESYSTRWNVDVTRDKIVFCDGLHDKSDRCIEEYITINRKSAGVYRHKKRGTLYKVIGDGSLQVEDGVVLKDGDTLRAYVGIVDGKIWLREVSEFNDGRFEEIEVEQVEEKISDVGNDGPTRIFHEVGLSIPGSQQSEELRQLVAAARKWYDNATDEEKYAMLEAQKKAITGGTFGPTDLMGTVVHQH